MRALLLDNNDMHPEGGTRRSCNVWAPLVIFWLTKRMTHPLFSLFQVPVSIVTVSATPPQRCNAMRCQFLGQAMPATQLTGTGVDQNQGQG